MIANISFGTEHGGMSASLVRLLDEASLDAMLTFAKTQQIPVAHLLTRHDVIMALLRYLNDGQLAELTESLIRARYGRMSIRELLDTLIARSVERSRRPAPRLDRVSQDDAALVQGSPDCWTYTMRGHDVTIDLARHSVGCSCTYFTFSARHGGLCKHLATAFALMPEVYAREALIDLIIAQSDSDNPRGGWRFTGTRQPARAA